MWFLLFIKQLPVMAMSEIKEVIPPRMKHEQDSEHDLTADQIDPDQMGVAH